MWWPFGGNAFPGTNLQDLNLDWIVKRVKELSKGIIAPWINPGNYNWMVYDTDTEQFVDSGVSAAGDGVGPAGPQGPPGPRGDPGKSPVIGSNGNWYVYDINSEAYVDTGTPALNAMISRLTAGTVSIIGDSISSYNGYEHNVSGYASYYPWGDVDSYNKMWWAHIAKAANISILVNASYSGSAVTNIRQPRPTLFDRCNTNIIGTPDNVIIALGSNDSSDSAPLGNYDYNSAYTDLSEGTFRTAYIKGIKKLRADLPNAKIICVIFQMGEAYRDSIISICARLNVECVLCDSYTTVASVHPDENGMHNIASLFTANYNYANNNNIISNTDVITLYNEAASSEAFTCSAIRAFKWGRLVMISVEGLVPTARQTSWSDIIDGLPAASFAPSVTMIATAETNPATPVFSRKARIRISGTKLQFQQGEANLSYTGFYAYFTAE